MANGFLMDEILLAGIIDRIGFSLQMQWGHQILAGARQAEGRPASSSLPTSNRNRTHPNQKRPRAILRAFWRRVSDGYGHDGGVGAGCVGARVGTGVAVGGAMVGRGVAVGGAAVAVGGSAVAVGGAIVAVGGSAVAVGGAIVAVGGSLVGAIVGTDVGDMVGTRVGTIVGGNVGDGEPGMDVGEGSGGMVGVRVGVAGSVAVGKAVGGTGVFGTIVRVGCSRVGMGDGTLPAGVWDVAEMVAAGWPCCRVGVEVTAGVFWMDGVSSSRLSTAPA